jgi:hypothetical protein
MASAAFLSNRLHWFAYSHCQVQLWADHVSDGISLSSIALTVVVFACLAYGSYGNQETLLEQRPTLVQAAPAVQLQSGYGSR